MSIAEAQDTLATLQAAPSELSLALPDDLTYDRWRGMARPLGLMARASMWWLGEWVNFGERRYGDTYSQALNDTGLPYSTLSNAARVARAFPDIRRRKSLSWGHHGEVAALPPEQADAFLDAAEQGDWTRAELRTAVREARRLEAGEPPERAFVALAPVDDREDPAPLPDGRPASLDDSALASPWPVRGVADGLLADPLPAGEIAHGPQLRGWYRCPDGADVAGWAAGMAERWRRGELAEAVCLVPAATDAGWWRALRPAAICLVAGRLEGAEGPAALAYLGPRPGAFAAAFGGLGQVWLPWEGEAECGD